MTNIEEAKFSDAVKHSVIAFAIGAVLGLLITMFSYIFSLVLRIPGLRMLKRVKREEVHNLASGIRHDSGLKPTVVGGPIKGIVDELREKMLHGLLEEGLPLNVARALVHNRDRLQYNIDRWDALITLVKGLLAQGYSEFLVAAHLELSLENPTAPRLELIQVMFDKGLEDHSLFREALSVKGYGVMEFEEAIRLHDVEERDWVSALRSSFSKVAKC